MKKSQIITLSLLCAMIGSQLIAVNQTQVETAKNHAAAAKSTAKLIARSTVQTNAAAAKSTAKTKVATAQTDKATAKNTPIIMNSSTYTVTVSFYSSSSSTTASSTVTLYPKPTTSTTQSSNTPYYCSIPTNTAFITVSSSTSTSSTYSIPISTGISYVIFYNKEAEAIQIISAKDAQDASTVINNSPNTIIVTFYQGVYPSIEKLTSTSLAGISDTKTIATHTSRLNRFASIPTNANYIQLGTENMYFNVYPSTIKKYIIFLDAYYNTVTLTNGTSAFTTAQTNRATIKNNAPVQVTVSCSTNNLQPISTVTLPALDSGTNKIAKYEHIPYDTFMIYATAPGYITTSTTYSKSEPIHFIIYAKNDYLKIMTQDEAISTAKATAQTDKAKAKATAKANAKSTAKANAKANAKSAVKNTNIIMNSSTETVTVSFYSNSDDPIEKSITLDPKPTTQSLTSTTQSSKKPFHFPIPTNTASITVSSNSSSPFSISISTGTSYVIFYNKKVSQLQITSFGSAQDGPIIINDLPYTVTTTFVNSSGETLASASLAGISGTKTITTHTSRLNRFVGIPKNTYKIKVEGSGLSGKLELVDGPTVEEYVIIQNIPKNSGSAATELIIVAADKATAQIAKTTVQNSSQYATDKAAAKATA
jgi:hypothetical protein